MKTLVLQLDRTEDAGSIRDKVTWGKASRVLLVWPVNFLLLDRKIDLMTIKRICASQGSRLGIVCDIPEIIAEAEDLNIPVFESVNLAMRKSWDRRKVRKASGPISYKEIGNSDIEQLRIDNYRAIEFWKINQKMNTPIFLTAIIAVVVLLFFLFPSANVTIFPQGRLSEMQIEFRVHEAKDNTSTPGILAAAKKTLTLNGETTIPSTGSQQVPELKAGGYVTITNLTSREVAIPSGTIINTLSNPPIRYKILEKVTIPAEEAIAKIAVEAVDPGESGNTDANSITSLDGSLGLQIEVTNPDPMTGGSNKIYQAVAEADISQAADKLKKILTSQAEIEFTKILSDQEIILPSSIQVVQIKEQEKQPEVGQVGLLFNLKQTIEFSVLVINRVDLERQADTILSINQPAKGWISSSDKPLEVQILSQKLDAESELVILKISASKKLIPPLDTSSIRNAIAGKSKSKAFEIINGSVLNEKSPEVQTSPVWLPFLPLLSTRIQVEVH
jgi:hypothetical protein